MFPAGTIIGNRTGFLNGTQGSVIVTRLRIALITRRKALGLSQEQVAQRAGLSRAYYTNIERGVKTPSLVLAQRIAEVLDTSVEEIFFDSEVPPRNTGTEGM